MPIINPWLFYFADISEVIRSLTFVCGGLILIISIIATFVFALEDDLEDRIIKGSRRYVIIGGIIIFIGILFPSEATCYKMMAASLVTPENIQAVGTTTTNMVDYIVDSIDQLLEEEENEESK